MPCFPASPSYFLHLRMSRLPGVWVAVSGFLFLLTRRELSLLEKVVICGSLQRIQPRAKELPNIYLPPCAPRCAPDEQIKRGRGIKEMLSTASPSLLSAAPVTSQSAGCSMLLSSFCRLALHKALPRLKSLPRPT